MNAAGLAGGDGCHQVGQVKALGAIKDGLGKAVGRVAIDQIAGAGAGHRLLIVHHGKIGALHARSPQVNAAGKIDQRHGFMGTQRRRHIAVAATKTHHTAVAGSAEKQQIGAIRRAIVTRLDRRILCCPFPDPVKIQPLAIPVFQ